MFQILVSMLDSYCLIQRLNIKSYHFTANEKKGSLCSQNSTKYLLMALWRWAVTVNGDLWIRWGSASSNDASSAYQKVPIKLQCTPTNVPTGLISRAHPSSSTRALPEVPITPACWTWLFCGTEKLGARLPRCVPASSSQRGLFMKASTYLAKIAVLLQEAPGKMLTFSQVRKSPRVLQGPFRDTVVWNWLSYKE